LRGKGGKGGSIRGKKDSGVLSPEKEKGSSPEDARKRGRS